MVSQEGGTVPSDLLRFCAFIGSEEPIDFSIAFHLGPPQWLEVKLPVSLELYDPVPVPRERGG